MDDSNYIQGLFISGHILHECNNIYRVFENTKDVSIILRRHVFPMIADKKLYDNETCQMVEVLIEALVFKIKMITVTSSKRVEAVKPTMF